MHKCQSKYESGAQRDRRRDESCRAQNQQQKENCFRIHAIKEKQNALRVRLLRHTFVRVIECCETSLGGKANVRHSAEFSNHGFRTPTGSATPLKKRRGCGCFTSVTGAILLVFVVFVVLNPWALHIGGRWTPAMTWHGVGKLQSTSGANYGLSVYSRGRNLSADRERFI